MHVRIPSLYFFKAYIGVLQMSLENIHGIEKYEVGGDWKGGDLLWADSKASSWFTSTNHR